MDYLFNGEIPDKFVVIGAIFIIGGNIVILLEEFKKSRQEKKARLLAQG